MEIRNNRHLASVQALPNANSQSASVRGPGSSSSQLQVSQPARELGDLARLVNSTSGIRQDKVDSIKRQIDSGSYQINLDKLADRMSSQL